jgi:hypothetical protein
MYAMAFVGKMFFMLNIGTNIWGFGASEMWGFNPSLHGDAFYV